MLATCDDCHDCALLLCRWLRGQGDIIPPSSYPNCAALLAAAQHGRAEDGQKAAEEFVSELPQPGQALLRAIVAACAHLFSSRCRLSEAGATLCCAVVHRGRLGRKQSRAGSASRHLRPWGGRLGLGTPLSDYSLLLGPRACGLTPTPARERQQPNQGAAAEPRRTSAAPRPPNKTAATRRAHRAGQDRGQEDFTEPLQPLVGGAVTREVVVTRVGGVVTTPNTPFFHVFWGYDLTTPLLRPFGPPDPIQMPTPHRPLHALHRYTTVA